MSTLHVLVDELDGQHEVKVEGVDYVCDHSDAHRECCILKVCQLDVHRTELDAPSDVRILIGRVFKSQRVPVGRLDVFKVRVATDRRALKEPGGTDAAQVFVIDAVKD